MLAIYIIRQPIDELRARPLSLPVAGTVLLPESTSAAQPAAKPFDRCCSTCSQPIFAALPAANQQPAAPPAAGPTPCCLPAAPLSTLTALPAVLQPTTAVPPTALPQTPAAPPAATTVYKAKTSV